MKYSITVFTLFLLLAGFCRADKLILTNRDEITGKLISVRDGNLHFKSEFVGEITADIENVQSFSTSQPVEIHFSDGTVINRKIVSSQSGKISIEAGGVLEAQNFNISDITSVNPSRRFPEAAAESPVEISKSTSSESEPSSEPVEEVKPPNWKGSMSAGLSSTHGNTNTENRNLSLDMSRRGQDDRITLKADYARGEQEAPDTGEDEVTENWWRSRAKYDYFLSKKTYVYGQSRYEKDSIAELDRRVIIGGGTGYQWIESDAMNFSTEAGLSSVYEKYEDQTESSSDLSAELGYYFDKQFWKEFKFINDLSYYPSTESPSDYLLSSTFELRASITENMFSNFRAIFDYDSDPAEDADNTDTKYIFGVGWNFQ